MGHRNKTHRRLVKQNQTFQLKQVKSQNRDLMNTLKNRSSSWRKAVSNNEHLQLKEIRKQNNDLIRTLKN